MKHLIRNVLVLDKKSPHYQHRLDILVVSGLIAEIGVKLAAPTKCEIVEGRNLIISTAFVDLYAQSGEPNCSEAESLSSLSETAVQGGFAYVCHQPSERAEIENKASVAYIQQINSKLPIRILPVGAITRHDNPQQLASLLEMSREGAVAFSSGYHHSMDLDILSNAIQYAKGFGGKLMVHPEKKKLSKNGQINQGKMSLTMGYKGIPQEAESIAISEIIDIASYHQQPILILNVTSSDGLDRIRRANKNGQQIIGSTSSLHLALNENMLSEYDTNFKLNPPLRSEKEVKKLRKAVLDGDIHIVYSQHIPRTIEEKRLEFDQAEVGAINAQTSFLAVLDALGQDQIEMCIEVCSTNPANYLNIDLPTLELNATGAFTIIDLGDTTDWTKERNRSRSHNSPFFGRTFSATIKGVVAHNTQAFFA
jgi:dihydroorotase